MLNAFIVLAVWVAIAGSLAPLARHQLRVPRTAHPTQPIQQPIPLHSRKRHTEGSAGQPSRAA